MRKVIQLTFFIVTLLLPFQLFAKCLTRHYGPTEPNERLWRISLAICPDKNVIPQQVMLAILKANPKAFNHANVNGLKSGYMLHIPSIKIIKRISPERAVMLVSKQNREWERPLYFAESSVGNTSKAKLKNHHSHSKSSTRVAETKIPNETYKHDGQKENTSIGANKEPTKTTVAEIAQLKQPSEVNTPSVSEQNEQSISKITQPIPISQVSNLNTVIEDNNNFKQQTNQRLANLEQQYKVIGAKIDQTQKSVQAMSNNLVQLVTKKPQSSAAVNDYWLQLQEAIRQHGRNLMISVGVFLLMILTLIYLGRARKKVASNSQALPIKKDPRDRREDFDYIPVESIASKLDLARAYIDMEDHEEAKNALQEVLNKGTDQQKKDALELMAKINK